MPSQTASLGTGWSRLSKFPDALLWFAVRFSWIFDSCGLVQMQRARGTLQIVVDLGRQVPADDGGRNVNDETI